MPFVEIKILEGATRAQKAGLVADVTRSLIERLGKRPETIHIVVSEVAPANWGYGGTLTDELLAATAARPQEDASADDRQ